MGESGFDGASVFPFQEGQLPEPVPESVETFRIEFYPRVVPLYELRKFAYHGARGGAFPRSLRKLIVDPGEVLELVPDDDKEVMHGLLPIVEHAVEGSRDREELLGVLQDLQLPSEFFLLPRPGGDSIDLGHLEFVELPLLRELPFPAAQVVQLFAYPSELLASPLELGDDAVKSPEVVQHCNMRLEPEKRLMLVLAVEIHKQLSHLFQERQCRRAVGDEAPALSFRGDFPADDELVSACDAVSIEYLQQLTVPGDMERPFDDGPVRPFANDIGAAPGAEYQAEGVDDD